MLQLPSALLEQLQNYIPTWWLNPKQDHSAEMFRSLPLNAQDIAQASARLKRFAPYIAQVFPQTQAAKGLIESPLTPIPNFAKALTGFADCDEAPQQLWLKQDNQLPISGSIKARGGIYEVLKTAEEIACRETSFTPQSDYRQLAHPDYQRLFSQYQIAVGSTGNLGLSIGIMSAQLGFKTTVHMSADAREWKKQKLRDLGVTVKEYADDYAVAVAHGRQQAEQDPHCHFIDDEHSHDLFLGYSVAAERLQLQLQQAQIQVDRQHPLIVYLPCGVGGGPGGIAFGLKQRFGDAVHCFFAEPTHSPCCLLGLASHRHAEISIRDLGLDNHTAADGLAVGRPSQLVCEMMQPLLDGCYTVADETLYQLLALMQQQQQIQLEPSALAGAWGPVIWNRHAAELTAQLGLTAQQHQQATHLIWATGGSMVPEAEMQHYIAQGEALLQSRNV
ncbi:D-serine ammonia-lyase [Celerinatantimonas sp. YJH-8]|uniref:D-serine ammonia-lyase n=1 Tax=Celerinatantimonas sp. YJH-8 TaxID=3228714 RepID=UPI0038C7725B